MQMSYFYAAGLCIIVSLAAAAGISRFKFMPEKRNAELRIAVLACIIFSIIYSSLSCLRYYQLIYGVFDFGCNEDMIRTMAHFNGFMKGTIGGGGYSEHFTPLAVFWVPFYWIWDSPYVLLIGQSVMLGAAGIPLYFCCRKMLKTTGWPLLIVMMYLLNPYLSRFTLYEYHMGSFYPLLFFSAWLAYLHHKKMTFLLLLLVAITAKESFCIVTIALGLYLCARKKDFKLGLACLGLSLLMALFILFIWFPHIIPLQYHHVSRYPPVWGGSIAETFNNLLKISGLIFSGNSLAVMFSLLIPFAFLPVLSWRVFILLLLPVAFSQICSINGHQQLLISHYSDVLIPLLPLAALLGLVRARRFRNRPAWQRRMALALCITMPLTANVMFCELPQLKYHSYIPLYRTDRQLGIMSIPFNLKVLNYPRAALFHEIKEYIPQNFTVCAQNNLGVFFLRHKGITLISSPGDPDFYVFDLKSFCGFDSITVYQNLIKKVAVDPAYACVYNTDGYMIFCRKSLLQTVAAKTAGK